MKLNVLLGPNMVKSPYSKLKQKSKQAWNDRKEIEGNKP